jgi:uncharacterized oxidoreductase
MTWAKSILQKMGSREHHSTAVAEHLIEANLAGHDSHGLVRLPQYASEVQRGLIDLTAEPSVVLDLPSIVMIDAQRSWGPVAANLAVQEVAHRAQSSGVAVAGLKGAPHIGRVGVYPLALAECGLIAQAWCNCGGAARVAPWGGVEPRLATNPIALAFPTASEPILVDITTSVVAEGKVRIARNASKELPLGWIRDKEGKPSTQPADLYEGGTILPLGGEAFGHKGSALAIFCDLVAGVLTGAGCGLMPGAMMGNGLLLVAIDPNRLGLRESLDLRTSEYLAYLRSSATREGVDEILLPGEPERRTRKHRWNVGIPIDDGTWQQLVELSHQLGIEPPPSAE